MLSQISATLSHTPFSLTATTAFSLRPSFTPKFRFYPFHFGGRRFSSAVSMDGSPSPSTVDSISEDLKNQRLENYGGDNHGTDVVNNAIDTDNISQDSVRLRLEELKWDNSFVRELPGDPRTDIIPREV